MATTPMPQPDSSAAQGGGAPPPPPQGGQSAPSSGGGQANDIQRLLAQWYQVAKSMSQSDPRLASGAEKVSQGIQEMQAALVTPPQPTPMSQQPSY